MKSVKTVKAALKPKSEVIELEAFGLSTGMERSRPVMLFREKGGESVLPVWLSPVDAGITLSQNAFAITPHDVSLTVLKELGLGVEACRFSEVKGHQQYVEIKFTGSKKVKEMRFRADHAISFCLQARARFFCTRAYLETCREIDVDLGRMEAAMGPRSKRVPSGLPYLN